MKSKKLALVFILFAVLTAGGYFLARWVLGKPVSSPATVSATDYKVGDRLPPGVAEKSDSKTRLSMFESTYAELQWDSMMPADWNPDASLKALNLSDLQDNDPRAEKALAQMKKMWSQAPVDSALDGKMVRIAGFAVPLEQSDSLVSEMLLVPYFGACIHTPPPPSNQVIHIKFKEPQEAVGAMQAYWVWGQLKVERFSSTMGDAAYQMVAAGIAPYEQQ